jgi:uncharacterized repeat protein (TIGR03803 family)
VFEVNTDGTGFATVHSFINGSDGSWPWAGLVLSGNSLYGTANYGGTSGDGSLLSGYGTVFKVNTDGTGFATLYNFTNGSDGALPEAGLILSSNTISETASAGGAGGGGTVFNTLYGTASEGGTWNNGTVFQVNTDGTGFRTLHIFSARSGTYYTNSDGAYPYAGLILSSNTLYGTAYGGGTGGYGTVFKVNTDGTGFATLYNFTNGSDGAQPQAGLILSSNTLYGTAYYGGTSGGGTVFQVNTDGTGFAILHSFTGVRDGANPQAGLILSGHTLYGTASDGGAGGNGTVFQVDTDGTGFATLYSFTARTGSSPPFGFGTNSDGANPQAGLILSGNTLYGTASEGGTLDWGTVFRLTIVAEFQAVTLTNSTLSLTWSTEAGGTYQLQYNSDLSSSNWINVNSAFTATGTTLTTTDSVTNAPQRFYRVVLSGGHSE